MKIYDEQKLYEIQNPDLSVNKLVYYSNEKEEYMLCVPYTEEELTEIRSSQIKERLSELSQDFTQAWAGAYFPDLDKRKREFASLHNELRVLLGKEPRLYY